MSTGLNSVHTQSIQYAHKGGEMQRGETLDTQVISEALTRASKKTFSTELRRQESLAALREHLEDCTCGQCEAAEDGQHTERDRSDQVLIESLIQAVDSAILAT